MKPFICRSIRANLTRLSLVAFGLSANPHADAALSFDVRAVELNGMPLTDPKNVTVSLGDLVTFDLFAIVTGAEGNTGLEGFSSFATGSLFSSAGGNIRGNFLSPQNVSPFNATASVPGRIQDLDGDGDLDLGSNTNDPQTFVGVWEFIALRTGFMVPGNATGLSEFRIHTTDFEVTDVHDAFDSSDIEVQFRYTDATGITTEAIWQEDGVVKYTRGMNNPPNFGYGEPVHLSSVNLAQAPEPSTALLLVGSAIGLGALRRRRIRPSRPTAPPLIVALTVSAALFLTSFQPARAALIGISIDGRIFDVNTSTGAASLLSDTNMYGFAGIAFQPGTGDLLGLRLTPDSLVKINPATGAATTVGKLGLPAASLEGDLAFNPLNGLLYGGYSGFPVRHLFLVDPLTGKASNFESYGSVGDYSALAFDLSGVLFGIRSTPSLSILSTFDPNTGAILTSVTMDQQLGSVAGMAFDPATGIAYVTEGNITNPRQGEPNLLYTLNPSTGSLTAVGALGLDYPGLSGLTFTSGPVPEPTTALLWAGSAIGLGAFRRRTIAPRS